MSDLVEGASADACLPPKGRTISALVMSVTPGI